MIKVLNNSLNLNIQGLNNFCKPNKENISDLFLFILLNLIKESFSENKDFSKEFSLSQLFNENVKENQNLIEKSDENKELDLIKLFWLQIFGDNELKSLDGRDSINSKSSEFDLSNETLFLKSLNLTLNEQNKVKSFELDEEKLFLIKEIISFVLNNREIDFSQLNQIFEKVFSDSDSNVDNLKDLKEKLYQIFNFLKFENISDDFKNKNGFLFDKKIKTIESNEILTQVKNLDINQIKSDTYINPKNYDENIQLNKEDFQAYTNISYTNVFQNDNIQKEKKYQNLSFKDLGSNPQNLNNDPFSINKKYTYQDELRNQFGEEILNLENDTGVRLLNSDDLAMRKGKIWKEEFKFYDLLEKKFKMEAKDFQKIFDVSLIKNDFRMENTVRPEDVKTMDFHKFPDDFLKIIKELSLEVQPEGEKRAFIKLEPPEMGSLDLEIKVKNRDVEIIVKIEKPELLQDMKQNLSYIKTTLEESGLNLRGFQLFLGSGFEGKTWEKDFSRKEKGQSQIVEKIEKVDEKGLRDENLISLYNRNGKYYYIA